MSDQYRKEYKCAYYGYTLLFELNNVDYNNFTLQDYMNIGSKKNKDFAIKAYEKANNYKLEISYSLAAYNIIVDSNFEQIFHNFVYPNKSTCEEIIKRGFYDNCTFLIVLNDWFDLYENYLSEEAYSLALYLNRDKYIELSTEKYEVDDTYFFKHLNLSQCLDDEEEDLWLFEYKDYHCIDYRKFSEYEICNNYDVACICFENNEKSNLVLSKLINTGNDYFHLYSEYKPFLLHTNNYLRYNYNRTVDIEKNSIYNILYINALNYVIGLGSSGLSYHLKYLELPEYNLYIIAKKYKIEILLNKILQLYNKYKKLYKIMDMENECYVFETFEDLPKVGKANILTGDELNPYSNNI